MLFDRESKILSASQANRIDNRMLAFKYNLMNSKLLYWDIKNSKSIPAIERRILQKNIINYLNNLTHSHPEYITNFSLPLEYKQELFSNKYWTILGDEVILSISSQANIAEIIRELSETVLLGQDVRVAIGYYTPNSIFYPPDFDFELFSFNYFKNQLELGKINDTKPSASQLNEYFQKFSDHLNKWPKTSTTYIEER